MSLNSINARIAEIQSRIEALAPRTPEAPVFSPSMNPLSPQNPDRQIPGVQAPSSLQPFNVALADVRPLGSGFTTPGENNIPGVNKESKLAGRFPPYIESLVEKYSAQNGVDPDVVRAIIVAESDGNPRCTSSAGAKGLMQLMPDEVKGYGITNPFDPEQSIMGGTRQLAEKLKKFNGDLSLALAAYNAGSGAVNRYNGIPPYRETQNYVKKILGMLGEKR